MRQPLSHCTRLATSAIAAAFAASCGDQPTRPPDGPSPTVDAGFAAGAEVRGQFRAALIFAGDQSMRGLEQREAADRVATAFETLAARVEANDRIGAERALLAADAAIQRYRKLAARDGGASTADLEALMLTLDHATALVEERGRSAEARRP
jgi:hypothetical protein